LSRSLKGLIDLQVPTKTPIENELDDRIRDFFKAVAGEDLEVDWMELKNVLDFAINKGKFLLLNQIF
jgi:hypothetical protein